MSNSIEEGFQSPDLKKLEVEVHDWVIENASIILEIYIDYTTSTTIMEESEEDQFTELTEKIIELKRKIKDLINKETTEKIPYIFHRLIMIVIMLLRDPKIRNSLILNAITEIYISLLSELKIEDERYSSLEPYQQFSPDTFNFIGNEISKDNNLVGTIDEEFWKDTIFKQILDKEENKLLRHSLRSLILYCNTIQSRKKRLLDLKK